MAKKTVKKQPRNYAATETTLINLRALKKVVAALEARVTALEAQASDMRELRRELSTMHLKIRDAVLMAR